MYELLARNYFAKVVYHDAHLVLPAGDAPSFLQFFPKSDTDNDTDLDLDQDIDADSDASVSASSYEILIKIVASMPSLAGRAIHTDTDTDTENESIKRWLMSKLFVFDARTFAYETSRVESLLLANTNTKYGIRVSLKFCPSDVAPESRDYEMRATRRTLCGANALLYVLMPLGVGEQQRAYLETNRRQLNNIVRLFAPSSSQQHPYERIHFMFISYLGGDKQHTDACIRFLLDIQPSNAQKPAININYCFCMMEGDVVRDDAVLHAAFRQHLAKHVASEAKSEQRRRRPRARSLAAIVAATLQPFLDHVRDQEARSAIRVPLASLVGEYNERVHTLIGMLSRDELRGLAWPMPEFIDDDAAAAATTTQTQTLKYWNSNECFDGVIRGQLRELLTLDELSEQEQKQAVEAATSTGVDMRAVERLIFDYLSRVLSGKESAGRTAACHAVDLFRLESQVRSELLEIASKSKKQQQQQPQTGVRVEWSRLLVPIVEHLVANGRLSFRALSKVYLDDFFVYCDAEAIASHDWINNRTASVASGKLQQQLKFAAKYSLESGTATLPQQQQQQQQQSTLGERTTNGPMAVVALKRRWADNYAGEKTDKTADESHATVVQHRKAMAAKRSSTSSSSSSSSSSPGGVYLSQLDAKLGKLFASLQSEKENNSEFESKLKDSSANVETSATEPTTASMPNMGNRLTSNPFSSADNATNGGGSGESNNNNNNKQNNRLKKDFSVFLNYLHAEKSKCEELGHKLDIFVNETK